MSQSASEEKNLKTFFQSKKMQWYHVTRTEGVDLLKTPNLSAKSGVTLPVEHCFEAKRVISQASSAASTATTTPSRSCRIQQKQMLKGDFLRLSDASGYVSIRGPNGKPQVESLQDSTSPTTTRQRSTKKRKKSPSSATITPKIKKSKTTTPKTTKSTCRKPTNGSTAKKVTNGSTTTKKSKTPAAKKPLVKPVTKTCRSSSSSSSEDSDIENQEPSTVEKKSRSAALGHEGSNQYFIAEKMKATRAKGDSVDKLKLPSIQEMTKIWQECEIPTAKNVKYTNHLMHAYSKKYDRWKAELGAGFNLLLSGFGSKHDLLENFAESMLPRKRVFRLVGHSSFTSPIKNLVNKVIEVTPALKKILGHGNMQYKAQCREISQYFSRSLQCVYILVHSIDAPKLRAEDCQEALSILAECRNIQLIVSMDHVNTPALWKEQYMFNWRRYDVPTFSPYNQECDVKLPMSDTSTERSVAGVKDIVAALTSHQKSILQLVAKEQVGKSSSFRMKQSQFLEKCRSELSIGSTAFVEQVLTELKSHRVLTIARRGGGNGLRIPLSDWIVTEAILLQEA